MALEVRLRHLIGGFLGEINVLKLRDLQEIMSVIVDRFCVWKTLKNGQKYQ